MTKYIIIALFIVNFLQANDDIKTLILQIKNAPVSQKRLLMNKLKLQLRNYNDAKRIEAIHNLQKINHIRQYNTQIIHKQIDIQDTPIIQHPIKYKQQPNRKPKFL